MWVEVRMVGLGLPLCSIDMLAALPQKTLRLPRINRENQKMLHLSLQKTRDSTFKGMSHLPRIRIQVRIQVRIQSHGND